MSEDGKTEMKKFLKEKRIEFLFGLISTAIGVLIALLINSEVNRNRDVKSFNSMLTAIEIEASQNEIVLRQSFIPNYKSGIVRRKFNIRNCNTFLSNSVFLKYVDDKRLKLLMQYALTLERANNFKEADEKYKYEPDKYSKWSGDLTIAFGKVLENCNVLINEVTSINCNK